MGLAGLQTAITYPRLLGPQRIYVFGTAGNGHLFVHYWDGFNWYWADQQLPVGASVVYNPTAITYANGPQQALYVFATADNGHLVDSLRT